MRLLMIYLTKVHIHNNILNVYIAFHSAQMLEMNLFVKVKF